MKELSLAELVELRAAKEKEVKQIMLKVKVLRKQIREHNKQIQVNLNQMVLDASAKEPISADNFGFEDKRDELANPVNPPQGNMTAKL